MIAGIGDWIDEMSQRGIRRYGNPLRPADEARTIRVRNGRTTITSGPFADTSEKIAAYELLECNTLEAAVEAASRHPMAKAGTIEVRPVWSELAGR